MKQVTVSPEQAEVIVKRLSSPLTAEADVAAEVGIPIGALRRIVGLLRKTGILIPKRRRKAPDPLVGIDWATLARKHGVPVKGYEPGEHN